jgi:hypothetical protein
MNHRIDELAIQAGAKIETAHWVYYDDFSYQKFAELIVKEMLDIFDKRAEPGTGFYEPQEPAEMIREHFGVEEQSTCIHDWYSAKNPVVLNGSVCVICGAINAREPKELKNERY